MLCLSSKATSGKLAVLAGGRGKAMKHTVSKGGQNPPNESSKRPAHPQGSGEKDRHHFLLMQAIAAVDKLHSDTSVPLEQTKRDLMDVYDHVHLLIDAVKADISRTRD